VYHRKAFLLNGQKLLNLEDKTYDDAKLEG
jgi:hypothetical protein